MRTLSDEDIRAFFTEVSKQIAESNAAAEKRRIEARIEAEAEAKKRREEDEERRIEAEKRRIEAEKQMEELRKQMGKLGHSYGEQIEAMFVNLDEKFNPLGFSFPKEARGLIYFKENGIIIAQVDCFLENGECVMAVEIKAKLKQDDIDAHIKRLGVISQHNVRHNDSRKVLGAVGAGIISDNLIKYAQSKGLYVLIQNGDNVTLAEHPEDFKPREL